MAAPAPELINPVPVGEAVPWSRSMTAALLADSGEARQARMTEILARQWDEHRAWGVKAGRDWVATLRTETRTLAVPGTVACPSSTSAGSHVNTPRARSHAWMRCSPRRWRPGIPPGSD